MALDAGLDVELPGTDCFGAPLLRGGALRPGRRGDRRHRRAAGCSRRSSSSGCSSGRSSSPMASPRSPPRRPIAGSPREIARKSLVLLRNDGRPAAASGRRFDRRDRTERRRGPPPRRGLHLPGSRRVAAGGAAQRAQRVRHADRRASTPSTPWPSTRPSVLAELRTRFGDRVRFARGCDVNSAERTGFAEAVALAAECDVAVMVMGDKAGLTDDCTSGESRDVASLDLPGRPGGARPRRARHRHAGRARARRRTADRQRRAARALRGRADGLAARERRAARRSPTRSPATSTPAGSCRSPTRGRSGRSPCTTATSCPAGARTGRATTSTRRRPAVPVRPRHRATRRSRSATRRVARDEVSWNEAITTTVTVTNTGDS